MAYTKNVWTNDPSKTSSGLNGPGYEVNAEKLNHMEDGIAAAATGTGTGTAVNDADLVHKTTDETIAGIKTFSSKPVVPDATFTVAKTTGLQTTLDAKANFIILDAGADTSTVPDGYFIFRRATAAAAIAVTQLTSGGSTTDGSSFTTASITPTSGALHLLAVHTGMTAATNTAAALAATSVTGAGLTWTRVQDVTSGAAGTTVAGLTHLALFVGTGTPSAGALTIAPGATVEGILWKAVDVANANTTIVQGTTATSSGTTPAATLAAVNAANTVIGFIGQQATNAVTVGTGFTAIGSQQDIATPSNTLAAEYKATGQNSVGWTATGTVQRTMIAIEVAPA